MSSHQDGNGEDHVRDGGGRDDESFSDELSPTDGYFSPRDHPQEMIPTRDEAGGKTSGGGGVGGEGPSGVVDRPASPPVEESERAPLLGSSGERRENTYEEPSGAPPAYSPRETHYGAVSGPQVGSNGARPETRQVLPYRDGYPVSISAPDDPTPRVPADQEGGPKRRRCWPCGMRRAFKVLAILLLVGFGLAFVGRAVRLAHQRNEDVGEDDKSPPSGPYCAEASPIAPHGTRFEIKPDEGRFGLEVFTNPEASTILAGVNVRGEIHFRAPDKRVPATDPIVVDLDVRASNDRLGELISYDFLSSGLNIRIGGGGRSASPFEPHRDYQCISISATVTAPQGVQLERLDVNSYTLTTRFLSSLDLSVDRLNIVSRASGEVHTTAENLSSRETIIDLISGDISGPFAQDDLLSLKTNSGNVDVTVIPRNADGHDASRFIAETYSGDIRTEYPRDLIEQENPRPYYVDVKTLSGDLKGTYPLGAKADLKATSANLRFTFLPITPKSISDPRISTFTRSGDTKLTILEPQIDAAIKALAALDSSHTSTSGDIEVRYPTAWSGSIQATVISGTITVDGPDIETRSSMSFPTVFKNIRAHRGEGHSHIFTKALSGDIDIELD